jgi:hypothetical protein
MSQKAVLCFFLFHFASVKQDETSISWLKGIICLFLQRNHISYKSLKRCANGSGKKR